MGLNLTTHGAALTVGVLLKGNGMVVAAGAFTLASLFEFGYLTYNAAQSAQKQKQIAVVADYERAEIAALSEVDIEVLAS